MEEFEVSEELKEKLGKAESLDEVVKVLAEEGLEVTKEELDRCSTCDLCAAVNDGLSEASREQLKDKTGEEIVDADIAQQMKQ